MFGTPGVDSTKGFYFKTLIRYSKLSSDGPLKMMKWATFDPGALGLTRVGFFFTTYKFKSL